MKLDPTVMRTMDRKDFRVLEAVEKGMRNHGIVPGPLVATLANLRHGGSGKIISSLLRDKLLSHETKKGGYDGYRITNAGYDIFIGTSQLTLLRTSFSGKGKVFVGVLADTADYYSGTHEKYWAVGYNLRGQLGATLKVADYTNMRIALKSGREFLEIFDHKGDRLRKEEAIERLIIEGAVSLSF